MAGFAPEALPDRRVFGVNRAEQIGTARECPADEVSGHDQDFFVGNRHRFSGSKRAKSWKQAGGASGGHKHKIDIVGGGNLVHREASCPGGRDAVIEGIRTGLRPYVLGLMPGDLPGKQGSVVAGCQGNDFETPGESLDNVEGLASD